MDIEKLAALLKLLVPLFSGKAKSAKLIIDYRTNIFPPCHARDMRERRGWPWSKWVRVHTDFEGHFTVKLIEASPKRKRLKG
jgi:hypothetical protein